MADDSVVIQFSFQLYCDVFPIEFSFLMMSAFRNSYSEFLAQSNYWEKKEAKNWKEVFAGFKTFPLHLWDHK